MGCREEILLAAKKIIDRKRVNEFSPAEVIEEMRSAKTQCEDSTIRTHISSRLNKGRKEKNHDTTHDDFERIERGLYRLINK